MRAFRSMRPVAVAVAILCLAAAVAMATYLRQDPPVSSFDECVRAGYPVAESYPEQCISPYGSFTRPVG